MLRQFLCGSFFLNDGFVSMDDEKIRQICNLDGATRLVITIGYAKEDDKLRNKKRKDLDELVTFLGE